MHVSNIKPSDLCQKFDQFLLENDYRTLSDAEKRAFKLGVGEALEAVAECRQPAGDANIRKAIDACQEALDFADDYVDKTDVPVKVHSVPPVHMEIVLDAARTHLATAAVPDSLPDLRKILGGLRQSMTLAGPADRFLVESVKRLEKVVEYLTNAPQPDTQQAVKYKRVGATVIFDESGVRVEPSAIPQPPAAVPDELTAGDFSTMRPASEFFTPEQLDGLSAINEAAESRTIVSGVHGEMVVLCAPQPPASEYERGLEDAANIADDHGMDVTAKAIRAKKGNGA